MCVMVVLEGVLSHGSSILFCLGKSYTFCCSIFRGKGGAYYVHICWVTSIFVKHDEPVERYGHNIPKALIMYDTMIVVLMN